MAQNRFTVFSFLYPLLMVKKKNNPPKTYTKNIYNVVSESVGPCALYPRPLTTPAARRSSRRSRKLLRGHVARNRTLFLGCGKLGLETDALFHGDKLNKTKYHTSNNDPNPHPRTHRMHEEILQCGRCVHSRKLRNVLVRAAPSQYQEHIV